MKSGQLFGSPPLLAWLPDETLFSLASRIHKLSGHGQARRTCEQLFGSRQAGIHHDFPNGLGEFERRTDKLLGTAKEIAEERTLLKYYRPFIPEPDSTAVAQSMSGGSVAHLKFRLGLITSRFRANHPLKACPACMAADYAQHGWAYWHLAYQFPGVWWCHDHGLPLEESLLKSTGVGRFLWHLPVREALRQWPTKETPYADSTAQAVAGLAETTKSLVLSGAEEPLAADRFWIVYREELDRRGWLTNGQRLRLPEIVPLFLAYAAKLRFLPELSTLPTTPDVAAAQLGRLLRRPRTGTHPLRHILLIDWLFGGAAPFLERYKRLDTHSGSGAVTEPAVRSEAHDAPREDSRAPQLLQLLREPGMSTRSAARAVGVDLGTAMAWAAKAGLSAPRRPKVLKDPVREALIEKLQAGIGKLEAAEQIGASVATVTRTLRTEPGLQSRWHAARYAQAQHDARTTWGALVAKSSHLGIKLLRAQAPAAYAWLYRHDRDWLRAHSPAPGASPAARVPGGVRWDKRDTALSTEVQRVTLALTRANPGARIYLWQLYQQIPELKAKLDVLDRLPLTKQAIERTLARQSVPADGLF